MRSLSRTWIVRIGIVLGVAGMLTPALLELGWIPENQALKALIFLVGFMVLDSAARESTEGSGRVPELVTSTGDYFRALGEFLRDAKDEVSSVVHGADVTRDEVRPFVEKLRSTIWREKQCHCYVIVAAPITEMTEEAFQLRLAIERDPSLEGRYHYSFIDAPVSFGCQVHDQRHWAIDFPPNPEDPRGAGIMFRADPEGARLVAGFIRHQWLEQPGVTMSLSEAYDKWKALKASQAIAE